MTDDSITERETREIGFEGRTLEVVMPTPEQLLVWSRILKSLQAANPEKWSGDDVMAALERGRRMIDSLLRREDVEWLDDRMLMGSLTLQQAAEIIQLTVSAFGSGENADTGDTESRPSAPPASGARRRAVT